MEVLAENVDGKKVHTYSHTVHHEINWGYVAVGVGVLAFVWFFHTRMSQPTQEEDTSL